MKKKIVRMTAILMSAMMLTGFTGCINPLNIDPSDPILEQQKPESYETVTEKAVNLTEGKVTDDITVILPEEASSITARKRTPSARMSSHWTRHLPSWNATA